MFNFTKYEEKLELQERMNPKHKKKYNPPLRPRSTTFKDVKEYNRGKTKIQLKKEINDEQM